MCGRYELNTTAIELSSRFGDLVPGQDWTASVPSTSYNIAPSRDCLVIRYDKRSGNNVVERLIWGFRPPWAKRSWINARDDTLLQTTAFREAARKRRCLVIATGWYEWQDSAAKRKQPYYIRFDCVFAFAGIWTARKLDETQWEVSFAIVTTAARGMVEAIHDRMPLVLDPRHYGAWLSPRVENPQGLLQPFEGAGMEAYPVSRIVNDPKNDTAQCIERAG
jgi:putative SOS response-associated peptidase YedK